MNFFFLPNFFLLNGAISLKYWVGYCRYCLPGFDAPVYVYLFQVCRVFGTIEFLFELNLNDVTFIGTQSQNSSKIWINQLVLNRSKAFLKHLGLGFGKKNNKKDLPSLYKKSQKWVLNFSKIWKNLSSMFFIYLKMLTIFFHKSRVTKIALMEQVFSILYES